MLHTPRPIKTKSRLNGRNLKIKASDLKQSDVFIFENKTQVAIEYFIGDCLWVTTEDYYLTSNKIEKVVYGYTSTTIISIKANDDIELIKNIEK